MIFSTSKGATNYLLIHPLHVLRSSFKYIVKCQAEVSGSLELSSHSMPWAQLLLVCWAL